MPAQRPPQAPTANLSSLSDAMGASWAHEQGHTGGRGVNALPGQPPTNGVWSQGVTCSGLPSFRRTVWEVPGEQSPLPLEFSANAPFYQLFCLSSLSLPAPSLLLPSMPPKPTSWSQVLLSRELELRSLSNSHSYTSDMQYLWPAKYLKTYSKRICSHFRGAQPRLSSGREDSGPSSPNCPCLFSNVTANSEAWGSMNTGQGSAPPHCPGDLGQVT